MTSSGELYLCMAGETFDSISLAVYGSEKYAADLLCANPEQCLVTMFSGGELLDIPVVEMPNDEDGQEYATADAPWKE